MVNLADRDTGNQISAKLLYYVNILRFPSDSALSFPPVIDFIAVQLRRAAPLLFYMEPDRLSQWQPPVNFPRASLIGQESYAATVTHARLGVICRRDWKALVRTVINMDWPASKNHELMG